MGDILIISFFDRVIIHQYLVIHLSLNLKHILNCLKVTALP